MGMAAVLSSYIWQAGRCLARPVRRSLIYRCDFIFIIGRTLSLYLRERFRVELSPREG